MECAAWASTSTLPDSSALGLQYHKGAAAKSSRRACTGSHCSEGALRGHQACISRVPLPGQDYGAVLHSWQTVPSAGLQAAPVW